MDSTQGNIIIALLVLIAVLVAGKRITWLRYDTGGDVVEKQTEQQGRSTDRKSDYATTEDSKMVSGITFR